MVTLTRRFSILLHNKRMKKEKKKEKRRKEEKRRHEKKKEEKRRRGEEKGRERKEGRKERTKGAKIVTFTSAECHWGRRPRQEGERGERGERRGERPRLYIGERGEREREMGKVKPRSRDFEILPPPAPSSWSVSVLHEWNTPSMRQSRWRDSLLTPLCCMSNSTAPRSSTP